MHKTFSQAGLILALLCSGGASKAQETPAACITPVTHAAADHLLREAVGKDAKTPKTNPAYKGGNGALKTWFTAYPLADPRAADMMFRVHIGFLVNCKGEAGDFRVISKGAGMLAALANELLEITKRLPQSWEPAMTKRGPVDCYQVLSFTISAGAYANVSVRE